MHRARDPVERLSEEGGGRDWSVGLAEFAMLAAAKRRGCAGGWDCGSEAQRGGSGKGTFAKPR